MQKTDGLFYFHNTPAIRQQCILHRGAINIEAWYTRVRLTRTEKKCKSSAPENYHPHLAIHFSHNNQSTKSLDGCEGLSSHLKKRSQHDFVTKVLLNAEILFTTYLLFQSLVFCGFRPTCSSRLLTLQNKSYYLKREIAFKHFIVI